MKNTPYKMKSAPVNMRTPGSIAKMAGVSPMKEQVDVTNKPEYSKSKKEGKKVYKNSKTGQITTHEPVEKKTAATKVYGKKSPVEMSEKRKLKKAERLDKKIAKSSKDGKSTSKRNLKRASKANQLRGY